MQKDVTELNIYLWFDESCQLNILWPSNVNVVTQVEVNIGSVIGLLSDDTKALSEPMLANHQWAWVALAWGH